RSTEAVAMSTIDKDETNDGGEVTMGQGLRVPKAHQKPTTRSGSGGSNPEPPPSRGDGTSASNNASTPNTENVNNLRKSMIRLAQPTSKDLKMLNDPRFQIRPLQQVLSACAGAMITACFMTPLDVIKTRMQSQQPPSAKCFFYSNGLMDHLFTCGPDGSPDATHDVVAHRPRPQFTSTRDALLKISRQEGLRTLWSGLGPTLVSALPSTIIYFVAYEQFKARYTKLYEDYISQQPNSFLLRRDGEGLPPLVPMMAGVTARLSAVTVVSPIELIRTKMQAQRQTYRQMLQFVRNVIALQGIWGLWRGLRPTILRDVPFSGMYWPMYEFLKLRLSDTAQPAFAVSFLSGVVAGSVSAVLTTPFDVVKTHEQIEYGERVIFTDSPVRDLGRRTTFSRLAAIYKMHGVRGLFAGVGPRLLKVAPACAIMISTFEYSKSFFFFYNVRQHTEAMM
ncbi:hypothetical protein KR018_005585, partial [Drosophila ironensis]